MALLQTIGTERTLNKHTQMDGEIKVFGIDLAKQSFQVHGVDGHGKVVLRKTVSREKLLAFMVQQPLCTA